MRHVHTLHAITLAVQFVASLTGESREATEDDLAEYVELLADLYKAAPHMYGADDSFDLFCATHVAVGRREAKRIARRLTAIQ